MQEQVYLVTHHQRGWCVKLRNQLCGLFRTKDEAFRAAVNAARKSRKAGNYAWVKIRAEAA
jgi:hypothetical protein